MPAAILYWSSLPPGVLWWDEAEAQAVLYLGGIFHPTGFPTYAIAGWIFTHAFPVGEVAWRASFFSALVVATAVGLSAIAARKLGATTSAAIITALALATATGVWRYATRPGVQSFAMLAVAVMFTCLLSKRPIAAAGAAGLALATHPVTVWLLPGAFLAALGTGVERPRWRITLGFCALAFFGGLSLYAYLPIRSAIITAAHVDPTASLPVSYHPIWDYDHPASVAGFVRVLSGSDYAAGNQLRSIPDPVHYLAYARVFAVTMLGGYRWIGVILALVGLGTLWARTPIVAIGLFVATFGVFPFSIIYHASQPEKYYLSPLWVVALPVAVGVTALAQQIARFARIGGIIPSLLLVAVIALNVRSALAGETFLAWRPWHEDHQTWLEQRSDRRAEAFIDEVRRHTPDDAIIAARWTLATPLYYAAYVKHELGNRRIVTNIDAVQLATLEQLHPLYYFDNLWQGFDPRTVAGTPVAGVQPQLFRFGRQ